MGLSRSIIIEKKWKFVLWLALISSLKMGAWPHITKEPIKPERKSKTVTKLGENMFSDDS